MLSRGPFYASDSIDVDLDQSLYALDSTTIDLCLSLFPWAKFRKHKAAVKMHTLLDLHGNIPTFIHITEGRVHDVNILDEFLPEGGAFYVMGAATSILNAYLCSHSARHSSSYVENVLLQRRYSHAVDKTKGVRSDHTVILTAIDSAKAYPDSLRRDSYLDIETKKRLKFPKCTSDNSHTVLPGNACGRGLRVMIMMVVPIVDSEPDAGVLRSGVGHDSGCCSNDSRQE